MLNTLDILEYIKLTGKPITFSEYAKILVENTQYATEEEALAAIREYMSTVPTQEVASIPSKGLGDTVAKITHATGLDKLAEVYTRITGKDCGCKGRQEFLNKLIPYGVKEENE
jgi:hypothetical protein